MRAALLRQLDRVVGEQVAVDDRDERQRARVSYGHFVEHFLGRGEDRRGSARRAAGPRPTGRSPNLSRTLSATRRALPRSYTDVAGELCAMASANRPLAAGVASRVVTIPAPADSPNSVTRSGSPPNAAMLSRTQRNAASTSRSPMLESKRRAAAVERRQVEKAQRSESVVERHHDDLAARRPACDRRRAAGCWTRGCRRRRAATPSRVSRRPARCPTMPRCSGSGSPRPAARPGRCGMSGRGRLRAGRPERGGVGDLGPPLGRFRRPETQVAHRRRGVADALPRPRRGRRRCRAPGRRWSRSQVVDRHTSRILVHAFHAPHLTSRSTAGLGRRSIILPASRRRPGTGAWVACW